MRNVIGVVACCLLLPAIGCKKSITVVATPNQSWKAGNDTFYPAGYSVSSDYGSTSLLASTMYGSNGHELILYFGGFLSAVNGMYSIKSRNAMTARSVALELWYRDTITHLDQIYDIPVDADSAKQLTVGVSGTALTVNMPQVRFTGFINGHADTVTVSINNMQWH